MIKKHKTLILHGVEFLIAALLLLLILFPFFLVVLNSLKTKPEILSNPLAFPQSPTLTNYFKAFQTMKFGNALFNTAVVTVFSQIILTIFSPMLAYFLARWDWKVCKPIFFLLVAAMTIPFQSLMVPFVSIFGELGILNSKASLIFFYLGFGLPMTTFMYHGFIKGISRELEEAAIIDGCSLLGVFWQIVFPLLKSITTTILILNTLWIWNDFLLPSLVLLKEQERTLPLSTFYFFGQYTSEFGYGMAALIMATLPVIIFYIFLQKQIVRGVLEGAIK